METVLLCLYTAKAKNKNVKMLGKKIKKKRYKLTYLNFAKLIEKRLQETLLPKYTIFFPFHF